MGKDHTPAVIPLVPRTARTIELARAQRTEGPLPLRADGDRLDRCTGYRWVRSIGEHAALGGRAPAVAGG